MPRSLELLTEACTGLPHRVQAMFGGHGFFAPNGGMFAGVVSDDEVVFKLADEPARNELVGLGGHAWVYGGKMGKGTTMREWIVVPDGFYDDMETFSAWAKRAHGLAPPKKAKKPAAAKVKQKAAPRKKKKATKR